MTSIHSEETPFNQDYKIFTVYTNSERYLVSEEVRR